MPCHKQCWTTINACLQTASWPHLSDNPFDVAHAIGQCFPTIRILQRFQDRAALYMLICSQQRRLKYYLSLMSLQDSVSMLITTCLYSQHCGRDMILWSCTSALLAVLQIIISVAAPACSSEMQNQLPSSLHNGMMNYLSDLEWKQVLDSLQQGLCCCGANKYADWLHTPWIHVDFLRENSHTVLRYMRVDGRALPPVLPWSCCNPFSPTPCLHDPLQQQRQQLTQYLTKAVLILFCSQWLHYLLPYQLSMAAVLPSRSEFISGIVLRYIYTSARNSVLVGDPGGKAYGWIFGRGDCRFALGSSLLEIDKKRAAKQKPSGDSGQESKEIGPRRHE
ncbi:photoreceptor outer segment membrane glycoprotein 2-like [Schistocerca piceifrons]|uniref:photoreceptor outer segment membrane glycoprotein 2-like n=1 Tax=Schistocerca piceifrons TaxID=274613 RepID=UPI001F5F661B|nr:photoreceptor outer segment membrane glycoprotein 2-like [Schistocerca piceifrons]